MLALRIKIRLTYKLTYLNKKFSNPRKSVEIFNFDASKNFVFRMLRFSGRQNSMNFEQSIYL